MSVWLEALLGWYRSERGNACQELEDGTIVTVYRLQRGKHAGRYQVCVNSEACGAEFVSGNWASP